MMPIDLLGRFRPGYAEAQIGYLHDRLRHGEPPAEVYQVFRRVFATPLNEDPDPDEWGLETWVAMHQRIWVRAVITAPRI